MLAIIAVIFSAAGCFMGCREWAFEKTCWYPHIYLPILSVVYCIMLTRAIQFDILYISPHEHWSNTTEYKLTDKLMNCASTINWLPSIHFSKIRKCMQTVEQYHLKWGRVPYFTKGATAFVIRMDQESVFTTPHYDKLSEVNKALIMIHECAHNSFGAKDIAYSWELKYKTLSHDELIQNADTYAQSVAIQCTNSTMF